MGPLNMCNNVTGVKEYDNDKLYDEKSSNTGLAFQELLPFEIIAKTLSYLDSKNLISSAHTCKMFHKVALNIKTYEILNSLIPINELILFLKENLGNDPIFRLIFNKFNINKRDISEATNFVSITTVSKKITKDIQEDLKKADTQDLMDLRRKAEEDKRPQFMLNICDNALIYKELDKNLALPDNEDKYIKIFETIKKLVNTGNLDKAIEVIEVIKKIPYMDIEDYCLCSEYISKSINYLVLEILTSDDIDKAIKFCYLHSNVNERARLFNEMSDCLANNGKFDDALSIAEIINKEGNQYTYSAALTHICFELLFLDLSKAKNIANMILDQEQRTFCLIEIEKRF